MPPLATGCTAASRCALDAFPAYSPDGRRVSFERVYGPIVKRVDPGAAAPPTTPRGST